MVSTVAGRRKAGWMPEYYRQAPLRKQADPRRRPGCIRQGQVALR